MTTLTAVDLGAQSGRVARGRFDGARLETEVVHRFANRPVRLRGRLHWDVLGLYREVLDGLRTVGPSDSIGVDSWAVDFGLLDRNGSLLANPVHYRDSRRVAAFESVLGQLPAQTIYERTGIHVLPINTLYELAAMAAAEDPALASAETLLMIPDLIHFWLTGTRVGEWTNAKTTQCLDAHDDQWAADLLERLGIPTGPLPELVRPGTVLGPLLREVGEEIGMSSAAVIAVATHDTASAVAAVPFRHPDSFYVSAGTWSLVGCELAAPRIDATSLAANLANEGGVEGTTRLLRNVTGLWLLEECRRAWAAEGDETDLDALLSLAETAPPLRSLIDPDDERFAAPGGMPVRLLEACRESGQPLPEGKGAVVRCILESLALGHAAAIDKLATVTGSRPSEIHLVGGGARNELLCRWTASAAALPVLAGPAEATLTGNLLVQAIALGELGSIAEARQVVRDSFALRVYEPDTTSAWQEARERFAVLAGGNSMMEAIR